MKIALATLLVLPVIAQAAPKGRLAYIQNDMAIVSDATTGAKKVLPQSARARFLAVSPRGDTVYFVALPGKEREQDGPPILTGYFSAPPYRTARKLPAELQGEAPGNLKWSATGNTLWIRGFELSGAYTPSSNKWSRLGYLPESASRDGRRVAYATGDEIRIRDTNTKRERVVFTRTKPQVLFNALGSGRNQKKLRDLHSGIDPAMWQSSRNWAISSPALSPDGSRLYFGSNVGTGQGASGNSMWALFAADLKTGKIAVLSEVGPQFGRMPENLEVSPDGKRLLCVVSAHSSAMDNPCYALVVDLLTQKSREVLVNVPEAKEKSNLTYGASWSPDGKYVAISATFYDVEKAWAQVKKDTNWGGPSNSDYTLYIKDAATGRTVRRIPGAILPSWGR